MSNITDLLKDLEPEKAEAIQEAIEKNYVGRNIAHEDKEIVSRIVGKTLGTFETKLNRNLKGIDENLLKPEEIKELGFDKALDTTFEKLQGKFKELSEQAKNNGKPDNELKKQLEDYKSKYEKLNSDYPQVLKQKQTLEEQLANKDQEFNQYKTDLFIDGKKKEALSKVPFTDSLQGATREFAMNGFLNAFNETYDLQPSDDDPSGLRIVDKRTGQRVAKDNQFLPLEEVIKEEAHKAGLLKVSNGQGGNQDKKPIFAKRDDSKSGEVNALGFRRKS